MRIETTIDQPCRWLAEGAWEWRFPTVVAPRYLGAEARVVDADRVSVEVAQGESPRPRIELALQVRDALVAGAEPHSPSHALALQADEDGFEVGLRDEDGARLDRDVVVRWPVASPRVGLTLDAARPAPEQPHADRAFGLLTVVPPAPEAEPESVRRDLIVLIDTSGSMHGEPLAQARRVVGAMVDTLGGAGPARADRVLDATASMETPRGQGQRQEPAAPPTSGSTPCGPAAAPRCARASSRPCARSDVTRNAR